jgi:signal transduction histidine kinase
VVAPPGTPGPVKGPRSLAFRLTLVAAAGSAVALLIAGILFTSLFQRAVERNFDERLDALLRALVGTGLSAEGVVVEAAGALGEPRFALPQSGWYWQIRDAATGEVVAASPSLFGDSLPATPLPQDDGSVRVASLEGPGGQRLRAMERLVVTGPGRAHAVLVAGDYGSLAGDIGRFGATVALTLGAFGLLLAAGAALLVRYGLRPLRDVRRALRSVRLGEAATLQGDYPIEIAPLVNDLNALLTSNREIIERARTQVGNLAHALKTPLAVLQNEARAAQGPLATKVGEQAAVMRDHINYYLDKARMAAQSNVIGVVTPVAPVVDGLARVMRKVHSERDLSLETVVPADLRFRGERQDLEEMAGNLIDNACKWAAGRVRVSGKDGADGRRRDLVLVVEDDGPGLAEGERAAALARGARLDESVPGSGLGLAIVGELVRVYGGRLDLDASPMGGLAARLTLPSASDAEA